MAASLLTVAELRSLLNVATGELADADLVQTYIDAVTEVVEDLSRPIIDGPRTLTFSGAGSALTAPWPFSSVTSVVESGVTLTGSDYYFNGDAGIIWRGTSTAGLSWATGSDNVTVVVQAGSVPTGAQTLAAVKLFKHLWRDRTMPRLSGTFAPDTTYTPSGFAVPHEVAELLMTVPRFPGFA